MKKKFKAGAVILILLAILLVLALYLRRTQTTGTQEEGGRKVLYWISPMDPSVRSDRPTKDWMGMDFIPVYEEPSGEADETATTGPAVTGTVRLSRRDRELAGIVSKPAVYRSLFKEINAVGEITYDERLMAQIASRVPGRVDKVFVDFTGQEVTKGKPLVQIYSPELISGQQEYLLALETREKLKNSPLPESREAAESLVESSKQKLLLWGITEAQIENLKEKKKVNNYLAVYAPVSGTVLTKNIFAGQYVKEGDLLYGIADLSRLWMLADVYEYEMAAVKTGQHAEITSQAFLGRTFSGRIAFIDPVLNEMTRSVKVRIEIPNPAGALKPGTFVNAMIHIPLAKTVAVPREAVLDTGKRKIVYVETGDGRYQGREVTIGMEAEGYLQVLKGVAAGELVVTKGNFLVDSQSQITGSAAGAYGGALEDKEDSVVPAPMPAGHQH
ncbi:MAG: efflux RND transporter periplasmic adaptor subunit [Candidatus Omnitrophota bacterium]